MISIIAWTAIISAIYFSVFRALKLLRVTLTEEVLGLDIAEMGAVEPKQLREINEEIVRRATFKEGGETSKNPDSARLPFNGSS